MKNSNNSELSILVVDDDENIRFILRQTLEKEAYHVSTAKSAEEALNTLQRSFFHVVITDIMMGEMNGVELLHQIKEMNSLMQIFVMTSHSTLPHVIQCMQGGAYDFFEKPLKIDEILISLSEAARRAARWRELYNRYSKAPKIK
ncbi:MAG: response regulator [SAR324 cluster bacterium]|nr:response regulator [SAR324 cluster bacterium]MBL7035906.1 response regulator [SAR324 cluster bacterium]